MTFEEIKQDMEQAIEDGKDGSEAYETKRKADLAKQQELNLGYELRRAFAAGANWGFSRAMDTPREVLRHAFEEAKQECADDARIEKTYTN